jgi:DNA-binding NarL/FixJ family response regulator
MNDQSISILLLARPGYRRNGIEAFLKAINNVVINTVDDCEEAAQMLQITQPDLLLIYPYQLDDKQISAVCDAFPKEAGREVIIIEDYYSAGSGISSVSGYPVIRIESSAQVRNIVLERFQHKS